MMDGPRGAKPRRRFSRRNIFIYGTLIVVSIYYLLPLLVAALLMASAEITIHGRVATRWAWWRRQRRRRVN